MNLDNIQQPKNVQPKRLSRLSIECIMSFMKPIKRLCLSYFYTEFRPIEKGTPLVLHVLHIKKSKIIIDKTKANVYKKRHSQICFDLFAGRRQFKVADLKIHASFSFELRMSVGRATVDPSKGLFAKNYSNITGPIEQALVLEANRRKNFSLPWVQNVDLLESISGDRFSIALEIFYISAKKICIDCRDDTIKCVISMGKWCKNKKRAVESELIVTVSHSEDWIPFVLTMLTRFGFVRHEDDSLRLPMEDNTEVVWRKSNENHVFTPFFLESANPDYYFHLKVQHSQS